MAARGWRDLLKEQDAGGPIAAYSEFMPPPRLGRKPYGAEDTRIFAGKDQWLITEYEEALELRPGLRRIGEQLVTLLAKLGRGERARGIEGKKLEGNPCWPDVLRKRGAPKHERYVLIMPLALSRTQDDKGRIRWTLFGAGEQIGPRSSVLGPRLKRGRGNRGPRTEDRGLIERLLSAAYGNDIPPHLVTFTPFAHLPAGVQDAYLAGDLHLIPFPGSLLFFHAPGYQRLQTQLPHAMQIPLLYCIERNEAPHGIRVPQSGWMHEGENATTAHGPVRNVTKRTNRWTPVARHEDSLSAVTFQERVASTLFSTDPADLGLYGKPMARNSQIWTDDYRLLLNGPRASREELMEAARAVDAGGHFGYRFFYPPMRVGTHEVYWHRPLVAWEGGFLEDAPLGHMTADGIELRPRLLDRPVHRKLIEQYDGHPRTMSNARKLVDAEELIGPIEESFARALIQTSKDESLEEWLKRKKMSFRAAKPALSEANGTARNLGGGETFSSTATRSFERTYWKTISRLAHGTYINKDNADVVLDPVTQQHLKHHHRDLDRLADHLLSHYEKLGAVCGSFPFEWETDFDFPWSEGWLKGHERNLLTIIPGRNRKRAVIMADHYDTAYMEDAFNRYRSGRGPRLAAAGADDNHSATAALMLAAPIFLELSQAGRLEHDIWLVHLTGEEFPADCLGARHLCQSILDGTLRLQRTGPRSSVPRSSVPPPSSSTEDRGPRTEDHDLSRTEIAGAFVLDMVAHNNRRARDIFQICPGWGRESMLLARTAHEANVDWNAYASRCGAGDPAGARRRDRRRHKRSADPRVVPAIARHLQLHGEVRPPSDAHSTLYNTDGQIFSDAGIPVVLLMENYDINRRGYHDSHDTIENIDLDYGAALVAIAIETVARAAGCWHG